MFTNSTEGFGICLWESSTEITELMLSAFQSCKGICENIVFILSFFFWKCLLVSYLNNYAQQEM